MKNLSKVFCGIIFMGMAVSQLNGQTWTSVSSSSTLYANPTTTNVGIGTSSPSSKLDIRATSLQSPLSAQIGGVTKFMINSNGGISVGGNTVPPVGGIYSAGHIYVGFSNRIGFGTWAEGANRLFLVHTGTHGYIDYKDNLHFRADLNWVSALTLYGNGSVGIGFNTTYNQGDYRNQGYKLAVNGGILCEEVKVISDVPNSDYVFEQDYELMSIQDVDSYIKEHKHLPNIPSAEEFKRDGYKVGEMDDMLLRKVEELTLYVIELQKQINELKNRNEE